MKEENIIFVQVKNSYICVVDQNINDEIAKYELDEDFSIEKRQLEI